ncbi:hypothetical protein niasHT_004100 [Heterodera trifolii]|uniref:F-box domain-containing protein n=1 Tax=Heterodera trifolii TaxID=157864 RepID=A0ABD2LSJ7_9BILA
MSDNRKEAEEKMEKAIFISGDGWLAVFDFLAPSQLGLGIATISRRFDCYVDEHFKTRKWTLDTMRIRSKIGENGIEMEMVNCDGEPSPIPKIQLPHKINSFKCITINYIDRNVIAFLHNFRPLFTACPINLIIFTNSYQILEFISRNILPMLGKNIGEICLLDASFRRLRQFVPSILNDCPLLRVVSFYSDHLFTNFPCDDRANASDGQAVAKWLFTAHPDNVPKVFKCVFKMNDFHWSLNLAAFKAAFASASSPANFIVVIWYPQSFAYSAAYPIVPFDQTNELTREQLILKRTYYSNCCMLVRCPIARDESKWAKWEEEAIARPREWKNRIDIDIYYEFDICGRASRRNYRRFK